MTIAERMAKEAYDRDNPWRPMNEVRPDGTICELLFNDMVGHSDTERFQYFLDAASGDWFRIDPPERVYRTPMNWRPAFVKMTPERRVLVKRKAEGKWRW